MLLTIPLAIWLLAGCDQLNQKESELKTIFIGPDRVDCEGEGPQTCYLVKENVEDGWGLWYYEIEGLDYETGYVYELIVAESQVENPPAGSSSIVWTVQEVVSKTEVVESSTSETAENIPDDVGSETAEELSPQQTFKPILIEDLGIKSVAPADWPKIEGDPLLKYAWGPGQFRFMAFHSVPGENVQIAMAQLLSSTPEQLAEGSVEGDYWEEQIGSYDLGHVLYR